MYTDTSRDVLMCEFSDTKKSGIVYDCYRNTCKVRRKFRDQMKAVLNEENELQGLRRTKRRPTLH